MYRKVYVNKERMEVIGCMVYDDSVPVRMDCKVCSNKKNCIYKNVEFEEE